MHPDPFVVRPRADADLGACTAVAEAVHALDGYPSFIGDGGLGRFITPEDAYGAWVATIDERVVGMVSLRPRSAPESVAIAARVLGVGDRALGFIARLEVSPDARRRGVARALLDTAVLEARRRALVPVLDVVLADASAVALYEAGGWRRIGEHVLVLHDDRRLPVAVYAAP